MTHLGWNVYCWSQAHQDRLLVECLQPAVDELRASGTLRRFWFDRFDARGPHVIALVTARSGAEPACAGALSARLDDYLATLPRSEDVDMDEVERWHSECRGKALCTVDREPGFEPENTHRFFEHPPGGYPFHLSAGFPREPELWDLLDELVSAALDQLAASPGGPATIAGLQLAASLDRELKRVHPAPQDYWRFHATTLIPPLAERLEKPEIDVREALQGSIGAKNRDTFSRFWEAAETAAEPAWPNLPRLVELVAGEDTLPDERRWRMLREIVHTTLKQLGVLVGVQVPLVLFAWHHHLTLHELQRS